MASGALDDDERAQPRAAREQARESIDRFNAALDTACAAVTS